MLNTKIEWTHHTVNFWWGCSKISPACDNCYAAAMDRRYHGGVNWHGQRLPRLEKAREECFKLERRALKLRKEFALELTDGRDDVRIAAEEVCRILCFVESMGDWLDSDVPIEWLAYLLDTIRLCPHVTFQLLTKRPELWGERINDAMSWHISNVNNYADLWRWLAAWSRAGYKCSQILSESGACECVAPANVWIGCTVENQEMADKRIPELLKIPARVRFLSCEPLLGPVDLSAFVGCAPNITGERIEIFNAGIDWVLCGGESGPKARPMHPDWARLLRDQCKEAGVPFFFKSWGKHLPISQIIESEDDLSPEDACFFDKKEMDSFCIISRGKNQSGHLIDGVEHHEFPRMESEVRT